MKEYTFSEARQRFASLLELARRDGAVRIRKRDGQIFVLRPEKQGKSPLDVPGLKLKLGRDELVEIIRSSRRPVEKAQRPSHAEPLAAALPGASSG